MWNFGFRILRNKPEYFEYDSQKESRHLEAHKVQSIIIFIWGADEEELKNFLQEN